ncbi:hypothetical protein P7C70_g2238, partial [Phenoliferia sp. Uapishka_3]
MLAPSNADFVITELALCRMGLATLFISVNNSPAAIAHLITETQSTKLVLHPTYWKVAQEGLALLAPGVSCDVVPMANPGIYGIEEREKNAKASWTPSLEWEDEASTLAFIVHSSGSFAGFFCSEGMQSVLKPSFARTGFPKPIYITHAATVANSEVSFDISTFTTLPLYHNGAHAYLWRAIYSIKPLYVFPASDLPLTPSNVLSILKSCNPEALHAVPYILNLMADSREGLDRLSKFRLVIYGGSAMPDALGDKLVAHGVNLLGLYDWSYNRVSLAFKPFCGLEPREDDTFELICKSGWPKLVVSNRPDGSYATKDLFVKHPTLPDRLKFVGRMDDTLVLVSWSRLPMVPISAENLPQINGEKINPCPMEGSLRSFPAISEAIVFGSARSQSGVLIVLSDSIESSSSRSQLLEIISPALKAANSTAPTHAELMPEMVIFLPYGTAVPKADKASIIRPKVYKMFEKEIDEAYERLEGNDGRKDEEKKDVGNVEQMEKHLLGLMGKITGAKTTIDLETDLFAAGLDSLQAGRIRNSIQREFNLGGNKLSPNVVFEYPTIKLYWLFCFLRYQPLLTHSQRSSLASYIVAFASGRTSEAISPSSQMLSLVEKYRHFPVPHARISHRKPSPDTVVVLTGATGSLGAQLLAALLSRDSLKRVYVLVRAKDHIEASLRVKKSLEERGMKGVGEDERIVGLASDFSKEHLGLEKERYEEIAQSVTLVLHNAWSVNFNLNISSFEPHIKGACNLINLCLESTHTANFYFASSVSAVAWWDGPSQLVPEAVLDDPEVAQAMGYAQSKWVTEKLCEIASKTTPVRAVVLRIGQMVGSSMDGRWNQTEAVSLMIKSAETIHALPRLDENVSWLPVDYAARIILELVDLPAPEAGTSQTWHIVQPRTVPWSKIIQSLRASGLDFEDVEPGEWLKRLQEGPQDPLVNPTIKLLSFFEAKYGSRTATEEPVARKRWPLDTTLTSAASPAFRSAPIADTDLIKLFVKAWRETSFLS